MSDRYDSFDELARAHREGRDFTITCLDRGSSVAILAPHGGGIEPGSSDIAAAIAGNDLSLYRLDGTMSSGNADLHITSTRFDEPRARALVEAAETALAIHGERSASEVVYIGGRHEHLRNAITRALADAGFATSIHEDPELQGESPRNICNRCRSGQGVQLEISHGLRKTLFASLTRTGRRTPREALGRLAGAIRTGLGSGAE